MRFRTWPVAAMALLGQQALLAYSLATAYHRARGTSGQLETASQRHRDAFNQLRRVRNDVFQSAISVRDYLLDTERARDPEYLAELAEFQLSSQKALTELATLLPPADDGTATSEQLRMSLEAYWKLFAPLFYWTPEEKATRAAAFVQNELLHRREEVLALAREIEALNDASYEEQRLEIVARRNDYQGGLLTLLWRSLGLGLLVSGVAVYRLRHLESRAEQQRTFAEEAERRMRALSQQIVATQEEERRKLSRELHDHVGQLLTGLRMSLGRVERAGGERVGGTIGDSRQIVDDLTRIVRDLASGLRPSMLDDLGLQPALEWLGRDLSRRCGLPITVTVEGGVDTLPDAHRTCVYRVVQEALNNAIKHARASRASVTVQHAPFALTVTVADDGAGFSQERHFEGLGLRGIEERAKELAGSVRVDSVPGRGTTVTVHLPITRTQSQIPIAEASNARLAG